MLRRMNDVKTNMENMYLGHPITYWLELQKKAEKLGLEDYISEIAYLRGRVNFYESRILEMSEVMQKKSIWRKE